ncbi:MAG: hypothetical protein RDU01_00510 [Thermodesulfovibrionales bacterium]|nr:hypothetical protein [Thermodesulfovibrionales bacterium]
MDEQSMFFTSTIKIIELAKLIYSGHKSVEINKEIAPLLQMILAMEENILSVKSYISKLEEENKTKSQELVKFLKWEETEKQYELQEVAPGIRLQVKKEGIKPEETPYWACPKCWYDFIAVPLNKVHDDSYTVGYQCPRCEKRISWFTGKPFQYPDSGIV